MQKNIRNILLLCSIFNLIACNTIIGKVNGEQPIGIDQAQRSFGRMVDDQIIETYISYNIFNANPDFQISNIVVTSFNGIVLLVGQVKSNELRNLATNIAKKVRNVRNIHNEITVSGATSLPARTNDAWLTTKIKSRMLGTKGTNPLRIKVIVENSVAYLMGVVSHDEATRAVELTRKVYGIQKIVKVFEYSK